MRFVIFLVLCIMSFSLFCLGFEAANSIYYKYVLIEDFDNFPPDLQSWSSWDIEPDAWNFTHDFGYNGSSSALHITGNTAKLMKFYPITLEAGDVWQAAIYLESAGDKICLGFCDDFNVLFYSIAGNELLDIEEYVTCYQGVYSLGQWHEINLPVGDDWLARFDYLPRLKGIIFLNDRSTYYGEVYFDEIKNMTVLLPNPPAVSINYEIVNQEIGRDGSREVQAYFSALVDDADSDEFTFFWQMGDSTNVEEEEFEYIYTAYDDHLYTVSLTVTDDTGLEGYASCQIAVEEGETSFPLTVNFTGDIVLARGIETIINYQGYEVLFDPTMEILGNASDITVANLECPLTTSNNHHPTKTIYFKGNPSNAEALSYAGVDIVTLANNHILDYMEDGIIDTQAALDEQGILYSGAGLNSYEAYRPVMLNRKGVNLAFLASSDRTGQYNNYQPYLNAGYDKSGFAYLTKYYMQKQINEVRGVSDLVIMELHCGSEYSTEPSSNYDSIPDDWFLEPDPEDEEYTWRLDVPQAWDREYRRFAIDAGADLVVCHHPHIIQGFEIYEGKLIAHSLGNFIFDLSYPETFPSCILYSEINEQGFNRFYVKPCYIDDDITVPAQGELGLYILDYLAHKSKELNGYLFVDRQNIQAEIILDTLSMPVYYHGFVEYSDLEYRDDYYQTGPVRLRKAGSISTLNAIDEGEIWEFRLGREIVYHGNFEPEGCTEWDINSSSEWLTTENPYQGDHSLCIELSSSAGDNIITNLEGRIKIYDDIDYSLHGYIRTENTYDTQVQIRTYYARTGGNYINMCGTPGVHGDNDWLYVWADLPPLEVNERYIDYRCTTYPPQSGVSRAYFDNVGLIGWGEWQSIDALPVNIESPNEYYYIELRTPDEIENVRFSYIEKNYGFIPRTDYQYASDIHNLAVLHENFPNPFNPETKFSFTLNYPSHSAAIDIYNIKGQKVNTLNVDISRGADNYSVIWQGDNKSGKRVSSGVYFYRLSVDELPVSQGKCLLLK
jgi:poly-gamma-glutamate capsule biosynthesis protein CapA/YwtB (metallophosphatase superfamily)